MLYLWVPICTLKPLQRFPLSKFCTDFCNKYFALISAMKILHRFLLSKFYTDSCNQIFVPISVIKILLPFLVSKFTPVSAMDILEKFCWPYPNLYNFIILASLHYNYQFSSIQFRSTGEWERATEIIKLYYKNSLLTNGW